MDPTTAGLAVAVVSVLVAIGAWWFPRGQTGSSSVKRLPNPDVDTFDVRIPVPAISISVVGGRRVDLTVTNTGDPFELVARGQLIKAKENFQRTPYSFAPRSIEGGAGVAVYTIATANETRPPGVSVKIRGDGPGDQMEVLQYWHRGFDDEERLWFHVQLQFFQKVDEHLRELATVVVWVIFDPPKRQFFVLKTLDTIDPVPPGIAFPS